MSASESRRLSKPHRNVCHVGPDRCRRDGWTAERQLRFLKMLEQSRSVTRAACSVGMSRESAYRLRERRDGALFALLWDRVFAFQPAESHTGPLSSGQLMRLLGNHFRRERGDFSGIGQRKEEWRGT